MIAGAPFLLSLAGLNASLAGLGGLLVGLRRGPSLGALEALRLRQVVEFAFANLLLAVSIQPAVVLLGPTIGYRIAGALTLAYLVVALPILQRRVSRVGIAWGRWWAAAAIGLTAVGGVLAVAMIVAPSAGVFELLSVVMLGRPMVAFLLVLGTIDAEIRATEPPTTT